MRQLQLKMGDSEVLIGGGPYWERPSHLAGVKLAAELDLPCEVDLPIKDFGVPSEAQARAALEAAIDLLGQGKDLYAGCYGGKGRTGLFMALLAKSSGVERPIGWTRHSYHPEAVETMEQAQFIASFDVSELRQRWEAAARSRALLKARATQETSDSNPSELPKEPPALKL